MPYVARCAFCSLSYDMIGKTETFREDVLNVFRLAGVTIPAGAADLRKNYNNPPEANKTRQYFSQLSPETRLRLYQLYRADYDMFGYSASEYL